AVGASAPALVDGWIPGTSPGMTTVEGPTPAPLEFPARPATSPTEAPAGVRVSDPGGVTPTAGVAELADAQDLGSCDASRGGSSPSARTIGVHGRAKMVSDPIREAEAMQVTETSNEGLKRELK